MKKELTIIALSTVTTTTVWNYDSLASWASERATILGGWLDFWGVLVAVIVTGALIWLALGVLFGPGLLAWVGWRKYSTTTGANWQVMKLKQNEAIVAFEPQSQQLKQISANYEALQSPVSGFTPTTDTLTPSKPRLIEAMLKLDRILLVGGTGSGKTEVMKWYVSELVKQGCKLTIMDPHSPSKLAGVDVIGARLDFAAIERKMIEIMVDVSKRYDEGAIAGDGDLGSDNEFIIIEEFRDIRGAIGDTADKFLEVMLVRARKAGKRFVIVSQNDSVSSLGLKGDTGLLKGCERVEVVRELGSDNRTAYVGWGKAKQVECTLPGPYPGLYASIPASQLVIDQHQEKPLTDAERAIALTVAGLNGEAKTISKNEILRRANVSKNGKTLAYLDEILMGRSCNG